MKLDKKPVSKFVIIVGLVGIILGIIRYSGFEQGFWLFIGLLIVFLSYVIISINRVIEYYIREKELDKKSVSKFMIIVGLICIILGIILAYFRLWGSLLAFIGFLIVLYGFGLDPTPPDLESHHYPPWP